MGYESTEVETENKETVSQEELDEVERIEELEKGFEAEARTVFNEKEKQFNFARRRTTDCKQNARVIFPKPLTAEGESKLEVFRMEMLQDHDEWVKEHCNCKGQQSGNLSKEESAGLKSLQKRIKEGELVVLPTDKSGRFALMEMSTYILAREKHTEKDLEIDLDRVRKNQKQLNGHVSMLLKILVQCHQPDRWHLVTKV